MGSPFATHENACCHIAQKNKYFSEKMWPFFSKMYLFFY